MAPQTASVGWTAHRRRVAPLASATKQGRDIALSSSVEDLPGVSKQRAASASTNVGSRHEQLRSSVDPARSQVICARKPLVSQVRRPYRNRTRLAKGKTELGLRERSHSALEAFITADECESIRVFNRSAVTLFGYNPSEVIGRELAVLFPRYAQELGSLERHHGRRPCCITGLRKNGEEFQAKAAVVRVMLGERSQFKIALREVCNHGTSDQKQATRTSRSHAVLAHTSCFLATLDLSGRVVEINHAALRLLDHQDESAVGRPIWRLGPAIQRQRLTEALQPLVSEVAATGSIRSAHLDMLGDRGLVTELTIKPIRNDAGTIDLLLAEGRDLTDFVLAEQRLRMSEAYLTASQQIGHIGHWIWDLSAGETEWSDEMFRILGEEPGLRRPSLEYLVELVHPTDRHAVCEGIRSAAQGNSLILEHRILRRDGEERVVIQQAEIVKGFDGRPMKLTGIVQDVTHRKEIEARLHQAHLEASAARRAKADFLAHMSHELRTPLNAIIGFSEIIAEQAMGPVGHDRYRKYADHIRESGQHLLNMVQRILDLSQSQAGKLKIREGEVSLANVAKYCVQTFAHEAQRCSVSVSIVHCENIVVLADELMLMQILLNLLSNAIKFTPASGEVAIHILHETLDGSAVLRVADTGVGIPAEELPHVLEPFGQMRAPNANTRRGTGLGLPLSKALTELHGGRLSIDSMPGKGTNVSVRLPKFRVVATRPHPNSEARPETRDTREDERWIVS